MKYTLGKHTIAATPAVQRAIVANYGDDVWEYVCDTFHSAFSIGDVIAAPCLTGLAERTRRDYCRVILANAMIGSDQLYRIGKTYRWR